MKLTKLLLLPALLTASTAFAANYRIDPDHSRVEFKIKHLAISTVSGKFSQFSGTYSYDPANVTASKAEATIQAKSINTEQEKRDKHLRDTEFFDVVKFPELKFVSTSVTGSGESFKLNGDLTIHGVTKPVSLDVTFQGQVTDPWGNERTGFSATGKVNRKDFGLVWNKALETGGVLIGDDVTINIEVEGIKEKSAS